MSLGFVGTYYEIERFIQKEPHHWVLFDRVGTIKEVKKIDKMFPKLTLRVFKITRDPIGRPDNLSVKT